MSLDIIELSFINRNGKLLENKIKYFTDNFNDSLISSYNSHHKSSLSNLYNKLIKRINVTDQIDCDKKFIDDIGENSMLNKKL
jgi:hypothetical protein